MKAVGSSSVQGFVAALIVHAAALGMLFAVEVRRPETGIRRAPVKIRLIKPSEQLTKEPANLVQAKLESTPVRSKPLPRVKKQPERKTAPTKPKLEPSLPKPLPKPPQKKFTVAMQATVPGGSVGVPAYSSGKPLALGTPNGEPSPSSDASEKGVDASEVTRLPRLLWQPSEREMRAAYPKAARRDGFEGNVSLKILVSIRGEVSRVRIIRRAGYGFDETAARLVKRFRFSPAQKDGRPVAVWIPWTYKFRLGD